MLGVVFRRIYSIRWCCYKERNPEFFLKWWYNLEGSWMAWLIQTEETFLLYIYLKWNHNQFRQMLTEVKNEYYGNRVTFSTSWVLFFFLGFTDTHTHRDDFTHTSHCLYYCVFVCCWYLTSPHVSFMTFSRHRHFPPLFTPSANDITVYFLGSHDPLHNLCLTLCRSWLDSRTQSDRLSC